MLTLKKTEKALRSYPNPSISRQNQYRSLQTYSFRVLMMKNLRNTPDKRGYIAICFVSQGILTGFTGISQGMLFSFIILLSSGIDFSITAFSSSMRGVNFPGSTLTLSAW